MSLRNSLLVASFGLTACTPVQVQQAALTQEEIQAGLTLICASPLAASPQASTMCLAGLPVAGLATAALNNPAIQQQIVALTAQLKQKS